MFHNTKAQRSISALLIVTFISMIMYPFSVMAQAHDILQRAGYLPPTANESVLNNAQRYFKHLAGDSPASAIPKPLSPAARFNRVLEDIHESLRATVPQTARSRTPGEVKLAAKSLQKAVPGPDFSAHIQKIHARAGELQELYATIEQGFEQSAQAISKSKAAPEMLQRHRRVLAQYQARRAEFQKLLGKLDQTSAPAAANRSVSAEQQSAMAALGSFMASYPNAKAHQFTDPDKLPFHRQSGKVRTPHVSKAAYQAALFPPQYEKTMLASLSLNGVSVSAAALPAIPNADDLAETGDVKLSPAIIAQAQALDKNPVKIYNWVRNNIQFMPTYGSIQGSEMTLQNRRGNAFDTASLLIALYRASGIPARYVYGTIEMPASRVMNWVGGVGKPEAAQSLLGQGGIPHAGVQAGGSIGRIQMEHVWVQAWVDNVPSGGAVNKKPEAWVAMDASYKQFEFAPRENMAQVLGFDAGAIQQAFLQSATVDPNGERISGTNALAVRAQLEAYQRKGLAWAQSIGYQQAVDRLQGKASILIQEQPVLLGVLPYDVVVQAGAFQSLPDNLRWKLNISYFSSDTDLGYNNAAFSKALPLAELGEQKIGLTYLPASDADAQTLAALKAQHATSMPAYLINGLPRLSLDNKALADGPAVQFGAAQAVVISMTDPQGQYTAPATYKITAGDEMVFVVDNAGVDQAAPNRRFIAGAPNTASESLQRIGLTYWMLSDLNNNFAAVAHDAVALRLPSVGAFASPLSVQYFFGIPRSAAYSNHYADIKSSVLSAVGRDGSVPLDFLFQSGVQDSNTEGLIFDLNFQREIGAGGSASRLLNKAAASGIAIRKITAANQAVMDTLPITADVKTDIRNAVAAGKIAMVPESEVSNHSWHGFGYILFDPVDGAGAYLISGGYNGGTDEETACNSEPVTEPSPAPAPETDQASNYSLGVLVLIAVALVIVVLLLLQVGPIIAGAGVALFAASAAQSAPIPGKIVKAAEMLWNAIYGKAFGPFRTGPPYPGDGMISPCSREYLDKLGAEKDALCEDNANKPLVCDKFECDRDKINERINNRKACIEKRLEIMFMCFNGGDGGHWIQVVANMVGLTKCQNCLDYLDKCRPGP